jgi:hypothetical protein
MMRCLVLVAVLYAQTSLGSQYSLSGQAVDHYNPLTGGGSMLDNAGEHQSQGMTFDADILRDE